MVKLTQVASWNPSLTNPYRTRYATAGGRYFEIRADGLYTPWFVDEITADGEYIGPADPAGSSIVFRLSDARALIEALTS
ncbi:hypothetical protein SEA_HIRKO_58 [Arthrobacter phage Hirko]|nr:hypothetical protein SEA_HIRKO_58 [Arthrobacter phage Hirko]